jgi:phosphoribosylamine--glycine ligase
MGAYAPALLINKQDLQDLTELVLTPTLEGLKKRISITLASFMPA